MKFKVICSEMFQTVESVIECNTYEELAAHIKCTRNAIYEGTNDTFKDDSKKTASKTSKKAQNKPVEQRFDHKGPITPKQKELILKKADKTLIEEINFETMTNEEASDLIDALFMPDNGQ